MITTGKGEPDGVLVVVRDSGPGLSSLDLERIFEAFYTTKSAACSGLTVERMPTDVTNLDNDLDNRV